MRCLIVVTLLIIAPGCASLPWNQSARPNKSQATYAERKQTALVQFERHRDAAQIQAALRCWEQGEPHKAQAMLEVITQRSPANVEARLRLAELLAEGEELSAAEAQLRECLQLEPNRAEAHHALGLLLSDWQGRESEADTHLARAHELEPENAVYAAVAR